MSYQTISLTDRIWNIQSEATPLNIIEILAKNRNIKDLNEFLSTSLKNSLPDPFIFIDMERAVNRLVNAILSKQKIAILGDYDVDGVSSVSIFVRFLEHIGADYTYSIPDRIDDGYGLNISTIEKHRECLIVAVDCGSNSLKELKYARTNGVDTIVIDHHRMSVVSEDAIIVNPHRPDEKENYRYLCASGLVFICIVGVNRLLREMNFYSNEQPEPDLMSYTDLTALATVCDVVDLVKLNRAFVSTGIKIIQQRKNFGIDALLSSYKGTCINSETISFFLGPKLNASGRMASSDMSVRLLTTKNPIEAKKIALQLDDLNKKRQDLEFEIIEEAVASLEEHRNFICLYNANWHIGIIGIIAGRLREKYHKPSIIISNDSNGMGKASCRSIEGVDISDIIRRGVEQGIIASGGGHSMAAGFSIDVSKI
ncbi:MAG: single-stranded-DNA-specific exonuclease RecJ, partial [Holosporaceae bacterium]|nr:single-stranded-DNA-specific exonuclease RecJ [Holosporaceae bacterium]